MLKLHNLYTIISQRISYYPEAYVGKGVNNLISDKNSKDVICTMANTAANPIINAHISIK